MSLTIEQRQFLHNIGDFSSNVNSAPDGPIRIKHALTMFDYIVTNFQMLNIEAFVTLRQSILGKLIELKTKNPPEIFDADKYIDIIFPQHKKTLSIIDDYIQYKSSTIIFDNGLKFTSHTYQNMGFVESIMEHIQTSYKIKSWDYLLPPFSIEEIRKDSNYPDGPFIKKISDDIYDLYEKQTHIKDIKGYVYNSQHADTKIIKIGRYGLLSQ